MPYMVIGKPRTAYPKGSYIYCGTAVWPTLGAAENEARARIDIGLEKGAEYQYLILEVVGVIGPSDPIPPPVEFRDAHDVKRAEDL